MDVIPEYFIIVLMFVVVTGRKGVARTCGTCQESTCPRLQFCVGQVIKDHCSCCNICSSDLYQPHVRLPPQKGHACDKVTCPKHKICMENIQGLPLCSCPSVYTCREKIRSVCGKDGITYPSRCHLRIAACNARGKRIHVKHNGHCSSSKLSKKPDRVRKNKKNKRGKKVRRKRKHDKERMHNDGRMVHNERRGKRRRRNHNLRRYRRGRYRRGGKFQKMLFTVT